MYYKTGDIISVQSYKHNSQLHRIWEKAEVIFEDDEKVVVANKKTKVIESNGRYWYTKEPSVTYFYKNRWFNIISIIKGNDISYYCNISSPILKDEEALKYIDYDLDLKVDKNLNYVILDSNEFKRHQVEMNYPLELVEILNNEVEILKDMVEKRIGPFNRRDVDEKYANFQLK